eukprot:6178911-Pleurochrysis_carterae.AAC.1
MCFRFVAVAHGSDAQAQDVMRQSLMLAILSDGQPKLRLITRMHGSYAPAAQTRGIWSVVSHSREGQESGVWHHSREREQRTFSSQLLAVHRALWTVWLVCGQGVCFSPRPSCDESWALWMLRPEGGSSKRGRRGGGEEEGKLRKRAKGGWQRNREVEEERSREIEK